MKYNIVGTGNMAWFLTEKLQQAGHTCICVYGRDEQKTSALAATVHAAHAGITDIKDDADCCIIAVTDTAVHQVVKHINLKQSVLVYTAGAVSFDIPVQVEHKALIWPIYSIVKGQFPSQRNIPVAWQSNGETAQQIAHTITSSFTDTLQQTDDSTRAHLHLSAVLVNNFTNHLMTIADEICNTHNLPSSLLTPIILQTVERIQHTPPVQLQTGPAKRNDLPTIEKHLQLLQSHPDWANIYKAITTSIINLYSSDKQ
jgi:NADP oxidoreductase coenzyme F420-dependent./Domain of unknown function (DUF2520).